MSLVTVRIETLEKSIYEFPDMESTVVDVLLSDRALEDMRKLGAVTLANLSRSCLVVPARIVAAIYVNGVERWRSPVSIAQ